MDVVIASPKGEIDMQYGLDTLKGTSDVISLVAEAILAGEIPPKGRRTHRSNDVRTKLKQSFNSSFGQNFAIEINKPELKQRLRQIGDEVFIEVMSYFILEALYLDSGELSPAASGVLDDIGHISNNLFARVKRPLIEMHQVAKYYNYKIELSHKRRGYDKKKVVALTEATSNNLTETRINDQTFDINAVIVRYHSKTGNGRLHVQGGDQFYSFGFSSQITAVKNSIKTKLSGNLHANNLIQPEDGTFVQLRVKKMTLPTNEIVKYLIVGLIDDV